MRRRTVEAGDPLERALGAVVADARRQVRAGGAPDRGTLEARVRGAAGRRRADVASPAELEAVDRAEADALHRLDRVLAVHRAFRLVARPAPAPPPAAAEPARAAAPRRFAGFRSKPTISGTLDVRRAERDGTPTLAWDAVPAVRTWEVRLARRPDPRGDWEADSTTALPDGVTEIPVPLDETPLRVTVLGQSRDGRPVRRVVVSGLTSETWAGKWERRATAS